MAAAQNPGVGVVYTSGKRDGEDGTGIKRKRRHQKTLTAREQALLLVTGGVVGTVAAATPTQPPGPARAKAVTMRLCSDQRHGATA